MSTTAVIAAVAASLFTAVATKVLTPKPPKPPGAPTVPTEDNQRAELDAAEQVERDKRRQRGAQNIFAGANQGPLVAGTQQQRTVLNG